MRELIKEVKSRLFIPLSLLFLIWIVGTVGYFVIGLIMGKSWEFLECAYMTSITLGSVGFEDILLVKETATGKLFTMFLIVSGLGIVMYCWSNITAFIVEGGLNKLFKERKMLKRISRLDKHYVVAGAGSTGRHVVKEMYDINEKFVVIERDPDIIKELEEKFQGIHYIEGDATEDRHLEDAGISRARGLVACLSNDKDNLYLTVSAKNLNPSISVVARAIALNMRDKLFRVGADHVVSPNHIGGLRMASEILRPHVVTFLDRMLRAKDSNVRVGEATVREGTQLAGKKLRNSGIKESTGLMVVAVMPPGASDYIYNPPADYLLQPNCTIIVIGDVDAVKKLKNMAKT